MKIPLLFILSPLFILATTNVNAQRTLNWEDCVRETAQNNPALVAAAEEVRQSGSDKKIAQSAALPQIDSSVSGQRTIATKRETNSFSYSVSGRQLLFDGMKTANDIKAAGATLKAAEYTYAVTSSNIRLNLRDAYAGLLRAQELIDLSETILERRQQNLKLVQLRHEAGREHKGALLTAEADLANAEYEVEQAKRNLVLARTRLLRTIGLRDHKDVVASGDLSSYYVPQENPDFESLADNTPLLKAYAAQKESARFSLNSQKGEFLPDVFLSSSAGKSGSQWPPDSTEWGMGISVSFPLFEGGSRMAGLEKAKSKFRQSEANALSGRDSIVLTLEETWTDFMDTLGTLSVQKKFLEAAEERARIASAQYSSGLINFDDWIIIENDLVNLKKSYLNAQANVLTTEARWVQAQGGTLEYDQNE